MEAAPLAVCAGLNVPHDVEGVQLQSTPAFELSFETVAATAAVAPGFIVVGARVAIAIEVDPAVPLEFEYEPTAPHPEKLNAKRKSAAFAKNLTFRALRPLSTGSPSHIEFSISLHLPHSLEDNSPGCEEWSNAKVQAIKGNPDKL
ncbi:MAG TPA: hypothetical protein VH280_03995, partial [Verrucomicrobiae bacterium]|nr:hypothetical protein [Verrucomicrobiae bacterium]